MTNLFCTPEQGHRLKELVPMLKYSFVWSLFGDNRIIPTMVYNPPSNGFSFVPPALTLQELRDLAFENIESYKLGYLFANMPNWTAPELADWVIARLENHP